MHTKLITKVNFCFKLTLHVLLKASDQCICICTLCEHKYTETSRLSKPKQRTLKRLHHKNESLVKSGILNVDSGVSSTLFWEKKIVGPPGITLCPAFVVFCAISCDRIHQCMHYTAQVFFHV